MAVSACSECGEKILPRWTVCPVCSNPASTSRSDHPALYCKNCRGSIGSEDQICPACHILIIRRYCSGCSKLIPDHASLCPFCGTPDSAKPSFVKRHKGPMLISGVIAVSMVLVGLLILSITEPSSDSVSLEPSVVAQQNTSRTAAIQVSEASKTKSVPTKTITFSQEAIPATTIPDAPQTPKDDEPITGQSAVTQSEVEEDPGYWRDRGARMMQGRKLTAHAAKYMKKGRYREATIVLANAVSSFPENTNDLSYGESLYKLGVCLRLTGKHQDAVQTLRKAMHFPAYESKAQREINLALAQIKKQTTQ